MPRLGKLFVRLRALLDEAPLGLDAQPLRLGKLLRPHIAGPPVDDGPCEHVVEDLVAGQARLVEGRRHRTEDAHPRARELLEDGIEE